MVFSSTTFLFLFLPFVILVNYVLKNNLRKIFIVIYNLVLPCGTIHDDNVKPANLLE